METRDSVRWPSISPTIASFIGSGINGNLSSKRERCLTRNIIASFIGSGINGNAFASSEGNSGGSEIASFIGSGINGNKE